MMTTGEQQHGDGALLFSNGTRCVATPAVARVRRSTATAAIFSNRAPSRSPAPVISVRHTAHLASSHHFRLLVVHLGLRKEIALFFRRFIKTRTARVLDRVQFLFYSLLEQFATPPWLPIWFPNQGRPVTGSTWIPVSREDRRTGSTLAPFSYSIATRRFRIQSPLSIPLSLFVRVRQPLVRLAEFCGPVYLRTRARDRWGNPKAENKTIGNATCRPSCTTKRYVT